MLRFRFSGASALIYRQCKGPRGKLLFVVKDASQISRGGDWVWARWSSASPW